MSFVDFFSFFFHSALFVLAWVIQTIIYPNFQFSEGEKHRANHSGYVRRASMLALPLMFGQLVLSIFAWFQHSGGILDSLIMILVAFIWVMTLFVILPVHQEVNDSEGSVEALGKLRRLNWNRTIAWTLIWILDVTQFTKNHLPIED